MLTFDNLVKEILDKGYHINKNFKIPDDIPYLKNGFKEINLVIEKEISIIFYRVGFNESFIMATVIVSDDEFSFAPYSLVENINERIIKETFNKYGVTDFE